MATFLEHFPLDLVLPPLLASAATSHTIISSSKLLIHLTTAHANKIGHNSYEMTWCIASVLMGTIKLASQLSHLLNNTVCVHDKPVEWQARLDHIEMSE